MIWTHAICTVCWSSREPGRLPATVKGATPEPCCFCGQMTDAGIYVRHDPRDLSCKHPDED